MNRKLIFFDIDGTIVDWNGFIPDSAIRAIHAARAEGNLCVINTGRPYSHIDPAVKAIGFDGFVCSCGQHLVLNNQVISHANFDPQMGREIIEEARRCRMDAVYEAEHGIWFDMTHEDELEIVSATWAQFAERGFDVTQSVDVPGFHFDKLCAFVREDSDTEAFLAFMEKRGSIIYREGSMLEITRRGYSKESGLKQMIALLGISLEDCYAIGDSTNDLPMLRSVSHSIAMGNAPDEVKAAAEYVTASLHEDGIEAALRHYHLIP